MFSEPVVGEKFYGRDDVLELFHKRVSALKDGYRQNIALTGNSLAGKTSIIQHFLYTIKDEPLIAVYIEVVREPFRNFANRFIATLLYHALTKMGEAAETDLEHLMERSAKILPKTHAAIRHARSYVEKEEYDEAYSILLGVTSILKEEARIPCIVILDEFDNLEYLGIKNPFLNFGKVIMVQKDTMYIVSSSRNDAIKRILSEKLSLLFGNFEIVKVSGFDARTAADFLAARLPEYDVDEDAKKFLVSFTGGNPFYLSYITKRVRQLAQDRMSSFIDRELIAQALLDLIYNSNGVIHQYLFNYLLELLDSKYRDLYLLILTALANGRNKKSELSRALRQRQNELSKHLARMVELGLASKNGVFYLIDDCVLEFWLKYVYQRRKDLLIDGIFNRTRLFQEELNFYISDFIKELKTDAISRLMAMFNRFANDLVQIESRYMKLPHFTRVEKKTLADGRAFILASFRGRSWMIQPYEEDVCENDIIDFIRNAKSASVVPSNKIIVPMKGLDENAKLLAKELRISIWDQATVQLIWRIYGKKKGATG